MKLDEFSTPHRTRADGVKEYDLTGLRPLKSARPVKEYSALEACVNTRHADGFSEAWVNTRDRDGRDFYRRTYESRRIAGQMVRATAAARSLAVRAALREARLGGFATLIVRHES